MQFPPIPRKFARLIALCLPLLFLLAFLYTLYLEARLIVAFNRFWAASPVMNVILALPFVAYVVAVALSFVWTFHCRGGIRIYGIVLLCAILLFFFAPYPCDWASDDMRIDFACDANSFDTPFNALAIEDGRLYVDRPLLLVFAQARRIAGGWSWPSTFHLPDQEESQRPCILPDGRVLRVIGNTWITLHDPVHDEALARYSLELDDTLHEIAICVTADARIFVSLRATNGFYQAVDDVGYNGTWEYDRATGALIPLDDRFFYALTAIDGSHIFGETEFGAVRRIELPSRH